MEPLLPAVARYIARANLDPANQPVMVTISLKDLDLSGDGRWEGIFPQLLSGK